jgi:hypothetical protein
LQSFRTYDVPFWLTRCMESVQNWAQTHEFDYVFMDDVFFELAPESFRRTCETNIYALTDICRLIWLKQMLGKGYKRVVWADADMLVIAPHKLSFCGISGHGFAREFFLRVERTGMYVPVEGINNSLMFFEQEDETLDLYFQACVDALTASESGKLPRTVLGPSLLKSLAKNRDLNLIEGIGLFTQAVMQQIASGQGGMITTLTGLHKGPLVAANLCNFLRNATPINRRDQFDETYDGAISKLLN